MLHKGHSIEAWKSEWIDRIINGENYSLHKYYYHDLRTPGQHHKYIATIDEVNPRHGYQIWGGSTPKIVIDLAKFSIDLKLANYRRWDIEKRFKTYNQKCLKQRLEKLSRNT